MQKSIGASNEIFPPQIVASQLKILMPVGTEMAIVVSMKKSFAEAVMPTVNMWWAHTLMLTNAIITLAATMIGYPNIALRENTGMISETKPNVGMIRT